jgi:hypothetical protein
MHPDAQKRIVLPAPCHVARRYVAALCVTRELRARNVMQRPFPDDPQHWRLRAEEARVHSELMRDPNSRRAMLEIADLYEQIARRAEERVQDSEKRPSAASVRHSRSPRKKRWF